MTTKEEMVAKKEARLAEIAAKDKSELNAFLTTREKLERKLETDAPVIVKLDYDLGIIDIPFKKFSAFEADRITKITTIELPNAKEESKQDELNNELFDIIGSHCQDTSLDGEFWREKKGYSMDVFLTALMKVTADSSMPDQKYLEEIGKFRK